MDVKTKEKWLTALRSGEYTQIKGWLREYNGFCCLGVLCDLNDPEEWVADSYRGQGLMLPSSLSKEVGLTHEQARGLANMNDTGSTFNEIADHIEANL